jgi:hypothetical protein
MPQFPVEDDLGIFDIPEKVNGERILCKDLAHFLGCGVVTVQHYARDRNCLHFFQVRRMKFLSYVSPFTAARIVVYVRAKQEEKREKFKRYHEAWSRRRRAASKAPVR